MATRRPWHVVPVGWIAVILTGGAALDYLLARLQIAVWLERVEGGPTAYLAALPAWPGLLWPVAVWAGLGGALCLAAGLRLSAVLLGIAAAAAVVLTLACVAVREPSVLTASGPAGASIMIAASTFLVLLWLYARQLHAYGRVP